MKKHIEGEDYNGLFVNTKNLAETFEEWAASWDCKEAETDGQNSPMIGDEIEVGTLWEDKSQKDFKSYL